MRRRILITGGTSGIGLELANDLSKRHDVMVTGSRPRQDIAEPLSQNLIYVQASQTDPESATQIIAEALLKAGWTRLDNVVLNAGVGHAATDGLDEIDKIRASLDVNLLSTILIARALFPWLQKTHGTLTIIGSVTHNGQGLFPAYAASKGALHGFARALRSEWAGRVSVQILHPGPTHTGMHAKAGHDPGRIAALFLKPSAMARMIEQAMKSKRSPMRLSWAKFIVGGSILGRRL
ncbi:MAG: SDR family oxidoreductase [Ahrensia sp.]|nr:SDR family oxidoreductase [Ahrensia sp.]